MSFKSASDSQRRVRVVSVLGLMPGQIFSFYFNLFSLHCAAIVFLRAPLGGKGVNRGSWLAPLPKSEANIKLYFEFFKYF